MFLFAPVNCLYSTNFICYCWTFEYASAHQIQWQDSQPNDSDRIVNQIQWQDSQPNDSDRIVNQMTVTG